MVSRSTRTLQQMGDSLFRTIVTGPSQAPVLGNALVTRRLIVTYQHLEQVMVRYHAGITQSLLNILLMALQPLLTWYFHVPWIIHFHLQYVA